MCEISPGNGEEADVDYPSDSGLSKRLTSI
jgi:hypothetical protein